MPWPRRRGGRSSDAGCHGCGSQVYVANARTNRRPYLTIAGLDRVNDRLGVRDRDVKRQRAARSVRRPDRPALGGNGALAQGTGPTSSRTPGAYTRAGTPMKNVGDVAVAQILNAACGSPAHRAEDRARKWSDSPATSGDGGFRLASAGRRRMAPRQRLARLVRAYLRRVTVAAKRSPLADNASRSIDAVRFPM
jgi:hypothetical protein